MSKTPPKLKNYHIISDWERDVESWYARKYRASKIYKTIFMFIGALIILVFWLVLRGII